jgi:hypothetical protein
MLGMALIGIGIGVVILLSIFRLFWRMRNEQLEPGGSWGQQIFGRTKAEKPDDF